PAKAGNPGRPARSQPMALDSRFRGNDDREKSPFRRRMGKGETLLDPAHAEVFDLEEILDAVFGALAADAGFLHAAEGGDFGGDDALVDADDAVFERFGDAPDAAQVARVEIGGEAVLGVVG